MPSTPGPSLNLGLCPECGHVNEEAYGNIVCEKCGEKFLRSGVKTIDYGLWPLLAAVFTAGLAVALAKLLD